MKLWTHHNHLRPKKNNNGGTAFVRINGKRIYLGKYGAPEYYDDGFACLWAIAAATKPSKSGCGHVGCDLNSG